MPSPRGSPVCTMNPCDQEAEREERRQGERVGERAARQVDACAKKTEMEMRRLARSFFLHGTMHGALHVTCLDDAVEDDAVVVAALCVPHKVLNGARALVGEELQPHLAVGGVDGGHARQGPLGLPLRQGEVLL